MEGRDSLTLWGADIPMSENPHVLNPPQGYVASANQSVTDSTYPYWYNGSFVEWRSWEINRVLHFLSVLSAFPKTSDIASKAEMMRDYRNDVGRNYSSPVPTPFQDELQTDVGSLLREQIEDFLEKRGLYISAPQIVPSMLDLHPDSISATRFQVLWCFLYKDIWQDEFSNSVTKWPSSERTVQLLLSDSTSSYYDDKKTQQVETLRDIVQRAFHETMDSLNKLRRNESTSQQVNDSTSPLEWYKVKNTTLSHLAKIPAFSYDHLKIGGWSNTINAVTGNHGPSWRMIVEMDSIPKAYAVYPGGQSGNPGSPHYGDFINFWVEGKYFTIQFLTTAITKNPFRYTWTLTP